MIYSVCPIITVLCCLLFGKVESQCQVAQLCEADVTSSDCISGQEMVQNAGIFGCCPGCQPASTDVVIIETGCREPFNCLPDGLFAPVQCKGDMFTGRCFCYNQNGSRIFGQMWRSEASEMTCACSRRRSEMEAEGRVVTLHCTPTGDYEPLQCDDGICWCVEEKTGQPTSIPVSEIDMKRLPCYDATTIGEHYLRQCESVIYAMNLIQKEQTEHGTNFLGNSMGYCDYDGSYGPYQIQSGIAYCTGLDGQILGAWQTVASEISTMDCNCARDTALYFPEKGMVVTEVCQGNGNYQPHQSVGDVYYCVDSDGYPTTEMLSELPSNNCVGNSIITISS